MTKKIVLMGNPNVGKSVTFSRLTGAYVIASNYPGTTVEFTKGKMRVKGETVEIIDAPGTYSLEPTTKAEEVALKMLKEADIVINVVDATVLERNLYLTLELVEKGFPVIVALNLWDEAQHFGIHIDEKELERLLAVPVIPTVALTGEGIKTLVSRIYEAKPNEKIKPTSEDERWRNIGSIIGKIQWVEHRHHTIWDRIADSTIKPSTGIPVAFGILFLSFWVIRFIGEILIGYMFEPIFEELYKPLTMRLSVWLGPGLIHDLFIGHLIEGEIDYVQSLGMLTTGIFVPIGMVLPYIIAFYFMLSILEDVGYLPRLATLADNVFHKLGMHGHGIIPVFLGLGCNVPGALSTRTLETRRQRFISATTLAIAIPCMAQISMVFAIFSKLDLDFIYPPIIYILLVFLTLGLLYIIVGLILNRFVKGESPEIFLEVPRYRRPHLQTTLKKTWMRVLWFLKEAIPWLLLGVLLVNILYAAGFIDWLSIIFSPIMERVFGLPGETSIVLLTGFLRKDLAVGLLLGLPGRFNPMQLVIIATILTIYFPCVATFTVLVKELGIKDMVKSAALMVGTAIIVGFILKTILLGI
jgi:ferrous iron transport protein B